VLLPFAVRAGFQLGIDLTEAAAPARAGAAAVAVVEALGRTALEQFLQEAINLAFGQLQDLLPNVTDLLSDPERAEADIEALIASLKTLGADLEKLADIPVLDVQQWLPVLLVCIDDVENILAPAALESDVVQAALEALTLLWCGGQLMTRIISWVTDPARVGGDIFAAPVVTPSGGMVARTVAWGVGTEVGGQLYLTDLVQYLLEVGAQQLVGTTSPAVGEALSWVQRATNIQAGETVQRLLTELVSPSPEAAAALIEALTGFIVVELRDAVLPGLLASMRDAHPEDEALAILIDELVAPLLSAVATTVLPRLGELDDSDQLERMKETLSGVLLQVFTRFLLSGFNVLLAHGMQTGAPELRTVGQAIHDAGEQHPDFAALASVAATAVVGIGITPNDAQTLLNLAADVLETLDGPPREGFVNAMRVAMAMGLTTQEMRQASLDVLLQNWRSTRTLVTCLWSE
jgi:hypothetical protein